MTTTSKLTGAALDWAVHVALYGTCEGYSPYAYSSDWSLGGPIIERELIELGTSCEGGWFACMNNDIDTIAMLHYASAPTPLIAAMRCHVASKLGDEVEVPEELTQAT